MPILETQGISQYYEIHGEITSPPVLLLTGLGGMGKSWGEQVDRFAEKYCAVVPDHRGVGSTTHTLEGHTTEQLATDMASLVEHLGLGPCHVVGASTGGAIAQYMAINHPHTVRSLILSSSFARFDAFTRREFEVRRKMAAEWDRKTLYEAYSLFLFSPRYTREHPDRIASWIQRASSHEGNTQDHEIAIRRIDMILNHNAYSRLSEIRQPTLVLCGDHNFCTPLPLSEELANCIAGAELEIFQDNGELIELEKADEYFQTIGRFIDRT